MKKFLLMLALMLPCLGAWAQTSEPVLTYENITEPKELSAEDATKIREISTAMTIVADVNITNSSNWSLLFSAVADYTSNGTSNNSIWGLGIGGNSLRYYVGPRDGGWYSSTNGDVTTSTKKIVFTYNGTTIKRYVDGMPKGQVNSTKALNEFSENNAKFYLGGIVYNTSTKWGNINNNVTITSIKFYNSVLNDEQVAGLSYPANAVTDYTKFVSGNVYTFQTKRGWLMTKEGADFVYSSGKLNGVTPAEDNVNCQWVYYVTENGKYLYNVGVEKFISYNSANLDLIPLADAPTTSVLEFKYSTAVGYPLLLGIEKKVVNHNLTNNKFTYGALLWGDGWTGNLGDDGSATLALSQGAASTDMLEAIKSKVDIFEAVAELDAAIETAQNWFTQYVGTGVGKYSATDDDYLDKFEAIVAFREAIQSNTTLNDVKAKIAELETLIASFQLNMPVAGKFYRIKGISGNYIDATSIYGNNEATTGQMSMKSSSDCNLAGTIFYLDNHNQFLNYATGRYVLQTSEIGAVGATPGVWDFAESTRKRKVGKYTLSQTSTKNNAGRHLHDNSGNRADRCSSICGDRHDFTIEEVTSLPVTITAAKYATFYAPVAVQVEGITANTVTVNGNWATLNEIEGGVIPAETGVILNGEAGTYNLAITTADALNNKGALLGTVATTMVSESAYVLSAPDEVVGLYKAATNPFQNNGFKAYLPASEVPTPVQALRFNFGGTTSIEDAIITPSFDTNAPIYDLSGRRVMNAVKGGLYIQNGKKFIVR